MAVSPDLVVLDEVQAWPEIFARLRGAIDEDRGRNGRFLLLGSVSPPLMRHVSESLAGRLALVELTPLALSELRDGDQRERRWVLGGYADGGVLRGPGRLHRGAVSRTTTSPPDHRPGSRQGRQLAIKNVRNYP